MCMEPPSRCIPSRRRARQGRGESSGVGPHSDFAASFGEQEDRGGGGGWGGRDGAPLAMCQKGPGGEFANCNRKESMLWTWSTKIMIGKSRAGKRPLPLPPAKGKAKGGRRGEGVGGVEEREKDTRYSLCPARPTRRKGEKSGQKRKHARLFSRLSLTFFWAAKQSRKGRHAHFFVGGAKT